MTVYLIYKEDAWHTKGSGELLRVADSLKKCYRQQPKQMELRKTNLKTYVILAKANVVARVMSLVLKHGR